MVEYILKNGIVFDPTNNIKGEKKDVAFSNGKIVEDVSSDAKVIDVTDKLVMAAGVDPHSHIAGPKLVVGRLYRPEDSRKGIVPAKGVTRSETGFSVPSCPATGYRYSRMGYGTVVEAAMPPLEAKHTHEEIMTIPNIDVPALPLFGNNWFVLEYARDGKVDELAAFVAKWLKLVKGYGIKIVNPCGGEAWGWGMNVHGVDDPAPYWDVTAREVVRTLAKVNEKLGLPHSIHLHPNDLGHPGNDLTTLESMKMVSDIKKSSGVRNQNLHMTHIQYHSYSGTNWRDFKSGAEGVAKYINSNDHVTCDVGQITLDETTTMTADGPMEFDLHQLNGLKWANKDIELETASGIVPFIYSGRNSVHSVQWAIGLELFLGIKNPWQVMLTTDSPNAGPFIRYPRVISWLMSNKRRMEMIENREVHKAVEKKSSLATLDREYGFDEIATISRAGPAKAYGFTDRGHLGVGANADIAVYDLEPNNIDPSVEHEQIEKAFGNALYTIKNGQTLVKDGEVVAIKQSQNIWTNVQGLEAEEAAVMKEVMPVFNKYYTIKFENYKVHDHFVSNPIEVKVQAGKASK
ncbi:formylmethanofuran dehydrogenase subunit A [Methanobrevibacter filiformis]|uniref:Formyltransferase/hydrolase complex Fhc subunit A n=1 Tax=Methanobrevibacter filiformis TaxID=55758 RepID=A0A166F995_9EURY|nr:formylmethanofuran dehydrogenase subunit A [Methanobrevibacter filiformis]KZX17431.1 formyltransferase/hydrolase complex Fhc subunit A [Methanobrevibacter filiformis]